MRKTKKLLSSFLIVAMLSSLMLSGCNSEGTDKIEVELVQYKPEAVAAFEKIEEGFNETHDNIHLTIQSPNEAMTILKTRFIREDYPDIVGIGGDINYSNFLDADMFMDISDFEGVSDIKQAYMDIEDELEFIPTDGVYALPYVANAAGILYNKDMFEENGWKIPQTWTEFTELCETIKASGVQPLYFGYKDTWTCLAPWNALAVGLSPSDTCAQVNAGKTTFSKEYRETAEKIKTLLDYCEPNPYAYGYNDACTAFARGQSAMYPIGSYAVPQIKSVNPDMNIDSFVFPANDDEKDNVLNSGVDLQFCVMKNSKNKEAVYEVLRYLYEDETIQIYLD
ncbi:MAG: ABC transporter substrate-binding protein, partial [Oscillospiraceae bacterium]